MKYEKGTIRPILLIGLIAFATAAQADLLLKHAGFTGLHLLNDDGMMVDMEVVPLAPRFRPANAQKAPKILDAKHIEYRDQRYFMEKKGWRFVRGGEAPFAFDLAVESDSARITVEAGKGEKAKYHGVMLAVRAPAGGIASSVTLVSADASEQRIAWPPEKGNLADNIHSVVLPAVPGGDPVRIAFEKPVQVTADRKELRCWLLGQGRQFKPGAATVNITFPAPVRFDALKEPGFSTTEEWIPIDVKSDYTADNIIGMHQWLDAPAGKHGWMTYDKERFVFADGARPVFWGSNLSWADMAPEPEVGVRNADRFAKYGINLMRFHKFLDGSGLGTLLNKEDREQLDPEVAGRFDRFHAELKNRGIYVGWSPVYIYTPGDEKTALALDEIKKMKAPVGIYNGSFHQLVNIAPDLQDIYIRRVIAALEHRNSVTGLRYADDPALAYIELHNEDMIFKDNTPRMLDQCPTYRKQINRYFSEWLTELYGGAEAFRKAWSDVLHPKESLEAKNIRVVFAPKDRTSFNRRELDSFRFLYEFQSQWYERFTKAIRETGYRGVIVAGCWQSQYWLPHLYNLFSDYRIGSIDRHNYMRPDVEMISMPGAGLLAAGIQQVIDRPFALSEWSSGGPWGNSMNAIIAAYGMGLQGWDFSGQFASRNKTGDILMTVRPGINNTTDAYPQLAVFPALARMVRRGDVRESEPVSIRRFGLEELYEGKIGYNEHLDLSAGAYLMGSIGSTPHQALAVGRTVLEFSEKAPKKPLEQMDLDRYWNRTGRRIQSVTGELDWRYGDLGFFTIDTEGTAAVVGNAGGKVHELEAATIMFDAPFATVFVTALSPGNTLADDSSLLITALARSAHRGDIVNNRANDYIVSNDKKNATLVTEPFKTVITLKRKGVCRVLPLDHEGRRTAQPEIPVTKTKDGPRFTLDGASTKTMYYVVEF